MPIFNEKVYLDIIYASKNIQCKIVFRGRMCEPLKKKSSISEKYKYLNIKIKWPSNIICICIHAISGVQIYLDICSVNM